MTDVRPFRALRYATSVDLSSVLAPVYDVVAADERADYWDRDPHSAIRLVLTREAAQESTTDYSDVRDRIAAWRREGVLAVDDAPALYVLRQRFAGPDGHRLERLGFFAALRLEDYASRVVRPHERTLAGPKADRRKLLRATRANLSSVFMLYEDRDAKLESLFEAALASGDAVAGTDTAGVENTLAPLRDPAAQAEIRAFLADRPVVIADGHHRYETALGFRDECREAGGDARGADCLLAYFANAFAPGSLLLPIHRLILRGDAPDAGTWDRLAQSGWDRHDIAVAEAGDIPRALQRHLAPLAGRHAFAADDGSGELRVFQRPADGDLSVRVIHRDVIDGVFGLDDAAVRDGAVAFPKSALQTAQDLRAGRGVVALYLNPLAPEEVFGVTEAGETLPQKSTFFQPKLPTGLLFRLLDES